VEQSPAMDATAAAPASGPTDAAEEHGRSLRRAATLTASLGIVYSVLFLLAFWLASDVPGPKASDEEITNFYTSDGKRRIILIGLYIMPFAGIAFLWFIVALRMWISHSVRRENALLSNIQLASGLIFVALFFAGAAASSVLAAAVEFTDAPVDPVVAREFPQYGSTLLFVFGMRMAAMFVFTTTNIGRAAGILPRWFIYLGFAVGLFLLLSASFQSWFVLVFPVWVLVLSALLFQRARRIPAGITLPHLPPARGGLPRG
jgi:MFS family permease